MIKTRKIAWALGLLLALTVIAGCTPAPAAQPAEVQPTLDVAALKAEIASTVIAEITQQAPQQAEAPAEQPVEPQSTQTPWVVTATVDAAQPTVQVVVPAVPTATRKPAASGGQAYPTITPTYYTDVARLRSQEPASYSVFTPGYDFDTKWTIENTGHRQWNTSFYYKIRRFDGTEFGPFYLPALTVGDTFTAILDTVAPSTPGNYTNTIWVVNDDGVSFFSTSFIFTVK
jgi:hypothetical protein